MTESLNIRRKRLRFRSWHWGTKELDLLLGNFADRELDAMTADQVDRYEELLEVPEPVMTDWLMGRGTPPSDLDSDVMRRLLAFQYRPDGR